MSSAPDPVTAGQRAKLPSMYRQLVAFVRTHMIDDIDALVMTGKFEQVFAGLSDDHSSVGSLHSWGSRQAATPGNPRNAMLAESEDDAAFPPGASEVEPPSRYSRETMETLAYPYFYRLTPAPPLPYSQETMETLAVIAYQQPVTLGDIEAVRGAVVSTQIIKVLEDAGWIEVVGHRETLGRPVIYATTKEFLNDLNLRSLSDLPGLPELDTSHTPERHVDDAATKLDLAKSYGEMGDVETAREILQEVLHEGDDQQKAEAQTLLTKLA